ncbi:hypothetical protein A2Z23_03305 [Candidatus Curtissbacteria bacterium RBG_16_39_7]|uniref:Methyltransferase type 11 domain-containing protein n=1 Tax=Candidatus Curtissbacteria bacterium RBG_16_39_7 TaxID=1797707 RepID=A0A1F5G4N8_9BACT|nr:MAG: hypothetical protein A2Z23_03305 [Candidatus Curtissbacteria bacterium RBG_16_39_7]
MKQIYCAICGKKQRTRGLYKANIDLKRINEKVFSARRLPDKLHYQLNECKKCGLVFSSPILDLRKINEFYRKSQFTYQEQTSYLGKTYAYYLKKFFPSLSKQTKILDVGCGNGFFLSELHKLNIKYTFGIEPSKEAVSKTPRRLKKNIKIDTLRENSYPNSYFDIICCFHTLDHVVDPNKFIRIIYKTLQKDGGILFIVHDTQGLSVKLFGEESPIFDIEHIYLFNKKTLGGIFQKNGFTKIQVFEVKNRYPLSYWLWMTPLPKILKDPLMKLIKNSRLGKMPISLGVGNIGIVAYK